MIAAIVAALTIVLHVAVNATTAYGAHRDELLYMAMGRHLQLWRMDFPPFIAIASELSRMLEQNSLVAIRILPAIAAAALVRLGARFARELGGGWMAELLAALCVATSPLFLRAGGMLQPVVFDQLWWTLAMWALARCARTRTSTGDVGIGAPHDWLLLGVALGLGLLTKFSIAFLAAGVTVAVLATPLRRALLTPWPWIATLISCLLGSPSVVGQVALGWPVRAQMADLRQSQLARVGPLDFLGEQLLLGPAALLALAGLVSLLGSRRFRPWRAVGISALVPLLLLLVTHGKGYYLGPVYPALLGAGAALIAPSPSVPMPRWARRGQWAALVLVVAYGIAVFPFGLPVLPPARMARYAAAMGIGTTTNTGERLDLPQDYADMLGWRAQAEAVARVVRVLPADERARVTVMGGNYGEAGAIDFHGQQLGLPAAVSPTGSYWFFGPGVHSGDPTVLLANAENEAELRTLYASVTIAERVRAPDARWLVPEERDAVVFVCRGPKAPLQAVWPALAGRN